MKLLLLADSHGKEMRPVLASHASLLDPLWSLEQLHVVRGRGIEIIRGDYRKRLAEIHSFAPDHVLIHVGHNNMVRHEVFNRSPLFITSVVHMLLELVTEIRANFPSIKIFVSTLLPRKASRHMSSLEAQQYNSLCKRFGQHLLSNEQTHRFITVLNRPFWLRISRAEPNEVLLSQDGLHVTDNGRRVLADLWLCALQRGVPSTRNVHIPRLVPRYRRVRAMPRNLDENDVPRNRNRNARIARVFVNSRNTRSVRAPRFRTRRPFDQ
jgi:hypothetical protein